MTDHNEIPEAIVKLKIDALAKRQFEEILRLVEEAKERFISGEYQPAESSLLAIPSLHSSIIEACEHILEEGLFDKKKEDVGAEKEEYRPGNYL